MPGGLRNTGDIMALHGLHAHFMVWKQNARVSNSPRGEGPAVCLCGRLSFLHGWFSFTPKSTTCILVSVG